MRQHAGSIEKWTEADLDFHLAIAKATHNPFFSVLLEPLVNQLRRVIAEGYLVPGAVGTGLEAHTRLYECIKNRDPEGAYNAIMDHLHDSEVRVKTYKEKLKFGSGS
jgi:GntR family transcriptional repressor for pyruvate dehydrogenase complex